MIDKKNLIEKFTESLEAGSTELHLTFFLNAVRQGKMDLHDDFLFKEAVRSVGSVLKISDSFFSNTTQMDTLTIEKWREGKSLPNLEMRLAIYMWIEKKISTELRLINLSK